MVLFAAALGWAPSAHAAALPCHEGSFFPRDGATVPANLPGVLFWPMNDLFGQSFGEDAGTDELDLWVIEVDAAGATTPVAHTVHGERAPYTVVPDGGFQVGKTYVLWTTRCYEVVADTWPGPYPNQYLGGGDDTPVPYAQITVGEAATLPTSLPELTVTTPVRELVEYFGDCSGCGGPYDAVSVYAELTASAGPWARALAFSTRVDGTPYAPASYYKFPTLYGKSWAGQGRDRLSTFCDSPEDPIAEGTHRVRLEATIPGTDVALTTNEVAFDLDCNFDGTRPTPPVLEGSDAGGPDAGFDGAPRGTNTSDARDDSAASAPDSGCSVQGATAAGTNGLLLLALGLWFARRRGKET